jgi:hypothetical protein
MGDSGVGNRPKLADASKPAEIDADPKLATEAPASVKALEPAHYPVVVDQPGVTPPPVDPTPPVTLASRETPLPALPSASGSQAEPRLIEDPLVLALRSYINKRPEEALTVLKRYDKTTQELLLTLLPLVARLAEGGLLSGNSHEVAVAIQQMDDVRRMLSTHAPFEARQMCFCSHVDGFGAYRRIPDEHVFQPGEPVIVYVEFKNFTSPWNGRMYAIRLGSQLEIRDYRNNLAWRQDFPLRDKEDLSRTQRHDFHKVYLFDIPRHIPPGAYTLVLHVTDLPTGRACQATADFQVGGNRGP